MLIWTMLRLWFWVLFSNLIFYCDGRTPQYFQLKTMENSILKHLSESDEILKKIIQTIPIPAIDSTHDVFHDLMS
jgi:hypothetical protein